MESANSLGHVWPLRTLVLTACAAFCITQVGNAQGRPQATIQASATVVSVSASQLAGLQVQEAARRAASAGGRVPQPVEDKAIRVVADLRRAGYVEARIEFTGN